MIAGALFYYQFNSWRNRLVMRIRRLRQPKYLFGAVVGGMYFYWYFLRGLGRGMSGTHGQMGMVLWSVILLVMVLLAWILPNSRAALTFTEAEVAFLFPAPVTRRTLIHFKLLKSQTVILFSAIFMTLIGRNWGGGPAWARTLGWWLVFATFNLHRIGSSFAMTRLMDRGLTTWRRRVIVLTIVGAFAAALVTWARQAVPEAPDIANATDFSWLGPYASRVLNSGPLPYVLYPFHVIVAPYFAQNVLDFLKALGPALVILGLHYWWVIRSDVAFEEASVDLSRKMAERIAAVRAGQGAGVPKPKKSRRPPFELRPAGHPAIALLWKNLISAGNMVSRRIWVFVIWITVFSGFMMQSNRGEGGGWGAGVAMLAVMLTGLSLFLGPQTLRNDLRQDLPSTDILKMYPLPGWQVVLGEVLAPAVILGAVQWILILIAFFLFPDHFQSEPVSMVERAGFAVSAAILLPCVDLIAMLIPNAAVLFFPAWFVLGKEVPRGFETTGQQLILMFGQLLILVLSLLPAGLVFAVAFFVSSRWMPAGVSMAPPAILAALILLGEAALGVKLLGSVFERFDLSDEVLQAS
jgi:hypothetical protein